MKTTNVYGEENLDGSYNIICPCCGKRMKPVIFQHNSLIDDKPKIYQRMYGNNGYVGVFMMCTKCNELFFGYSGMFVAKAPHFSHMNSPICGNANMFIRTNIDPTGDILTNIEDIFSKMQMDIKVYRPYHHTEGYVEMNGQRYPSIALMNESNQNICTIINIDVNKFIKDNIKVLKQ